MSAAFMLTAGFLSPRTYTPNAVQRMFAALPQICAVIRLAYTRTV